MVAQSTLPTALFNIAQIRQAEQLASAQPDMSEMTLMERAGQAALRVLRHRFPNEKKITIICGSGNNGGDGYRLAVYASEAGLMVSCYYIGDLKNLPAAASQAMKLCVRANIPITPLSSEIDLQQFDLIVDALLGIGIIGEIRAEAMHAIQQINQANRPVLALDVPSGLDADTGTILGEEAIRATVTLTFIGLKQGLFTANGPEYAGKIECDDLQIKNVIATIEKSACRLDLTNPNIQFLFKPRHRDSHKGYYGHVLVVGGDEGMAGAARMAAEAAARVGAGLVSVATRPEHVAAIVATRPELMVHGVKSARHLAPLLAKATVVIIGPGLSDSSWSMSLLKAVFTTQLPLIVDAGALSFLSSPKQKKIPRANTANWILTPHPGEAARLLNVQTSDIQTDRFAAAKQLQTMWGGVVVLKGCGTIIQTADEMPFVCGEGNPGMATGGMGDVLSGIIGSLLAQILSAPNFNLQSMQPTIGKKQDLTYAALAGVALHAHAADIVAAKQGERGMLALDLMPYLQQLVNVIR